MSGEDKEIPEDLFWKDFGGSEFERQREVRRSENIVAMTANGLLLAILGPTLLAIISAFIAYVHYCKWGTLCGY